MVVQALRGILSLPEQLRSRKFQKATSPFVAGFHQQHQGFANRNRAPFRQATLTNLRGQLG